MPFKLMHRLLCLLVVALLSLGALAAKPLPPEQAFIPSLTRLDASTLEVHWEIAPGYYLYRKRFHFSSETPAIQLGEAQFPAGELKDDPNFGSVEVYHQPVSIRIPYAGNADSISLRLVAQGCAEMGVCYPPQAQVLVAAAPGANPPAAAGGSESSRVARLLSGSLWVALSSFFGFGLLLAFTPCMLPMVPILSGMIVHHGHAVSHGRAFLLSLAYVIGMALTYAAAGVAAGLSGTLLSSALQNAWVLGAFALVFVVLSLSMFGFYELQLPAAVQSRIADRANRQGGSVHALFIMGAVSALIVGPCVAAPLAGALLYIAKTGNGVLGGAALFALALGMGAPLLAVGLFSRSLLPKTGPWMEAVKKFFGVLLLATALWLVAPVLPTWLVMLAWAALLIVPAIYLRAIDPLPHQAGNWQRFWKGVGLFMLFCGAVLVVGVAGGSRDPLRPLGFLAANAAASPGPAFAPVRSLADLDARLQHADRPVMLDFYADWCVSCKEMERDTFTDPAVRQRLDKLLLLRADVTANTDEDKALLQRFGLYGPPGIIFFTPSGHELENLRVIGFQNPAEFNAQLDHLPL